MSEAFDNLKDLIIHLRSPEGCPWDREQTLRSIEPHILEEAHEVSEAIRSGDKDRLCEELGDLIFLLMFTARIAEEEGLFDIEEVLNNSLRKMKQRHPHVFGDSKAKEVEEVLNEWEKNKQRELSAKGKSVMSGIPKSLPSLIKAQRIQQRAASLGFDWEKTEDVFAKLKEEIGEFEEAWKEERLDRVEDELGDILFALVNLARFLGIRAEDALQRTIEKFLDRFARVEAEIVKRGKMTLEEMDSIWEQSKKKE